MQSWCDRAQALQLPFGIWSQPCSEAQVLHGVPPLPPYSSDEPKRWLTSCAVIRSIVPRPQPPQSLRRASVHRPPEAYACQQFLYGRDEDDEGVARAVRHAHVLAVRADAGPVRGVRVAVEGHLRHRRVAPVGLDRAQAGAVRVAVVAVRDVDLDELEVEHPREVVTRVLGGEEVEPVDDLLADLVPLARAELGPAAPRRLDEDDADGHLAGHSPAGLLQKEALPERLQELLAQVDDVVPVLRPEPRRQAREVVRARRVLVPLGEAALELDELLAGQRTAAPAPLRLRGHLLAVRSLVLPHELEEVLGVDVRVRARWRELGIVPGASAQRLGASSRRAGSRG